MQNIFVTWHYTTHGSAFLKHILGVFYTQALPKAAPIDWNNIMQHEADAYWLQPKKGIVFDHVYYITAKQEAFWSLANRIKYRRDMLTDERVAAAGLSPIWAQLIASEDIGAADYVPDLARDIAFVRKHAPELETQFINMLWRDIQHYTLKDQMDWLLEHSNAREQYNTTNVTIHDTKLDDLRKLQDIAQAMQKMMQSLEKKHAGARFFINISLGSTEVQIAWHALSQKGYLPQNSVFLHTYDDKAHQNGLRFKPFSVKEVPIDVFTNIALPPLFSHSKSELRKIASLKMESFASNGFTTLILGERGTGKSRLAEQHHKSRTIVSANCAAFDDDSKAESELFGHVQGAFTGANKEKHGLFREAHGGGVLFLDEIHHLSKRVQEKLMKALQTNEHNQFVIRPLGSNREIKVQCSIILASNKTISELRETYLYEDFFDRITQNIVEIPPLRSSPDDRAGDWRATWAHLHKSSANSAPDEPQLMQWLQSLPLFGNFRDLQKIALYYHSFTTFSPALRLLLDTPTAFDYAKSEFNKLQSRITPSTFDSNISIKEMQQTFNRNLANWAIAEFGSAEKAAKHFAAKGDKTTAETLYRWRNSKIKP